MHHLTGIGVSPGLVIGRAVLLLQHPLVIRFPIAGDRVAGELARLEEARDRSRSQLRDVKARITRLAGADLGSLFDAQLLMLDDPMLVARARELIAEHRVNAEWAVQRAFEDLARILDGVEDPYLRERQGDVADVVGRLKANLGRRGGPGAERFCDVDAGSVLVADDLTPSMAAQVDWHKILGFATDTGSRTHHTAILARSLHVPAVVALGNASRLITPGATVLIDGSSGDVLIDPPPEVVEACRHRAVGAIHRAPARRATAAAPARTADGVAIALQANVELPDDLSMARQHGAEGIGLYRSEFLLAVTPADALTEEIQYGAYRALVEGMAPAEVTIRTFDIGEDALRSWSNGLPGRAGDERSEAAGRRTGAMGLRAIRLSLAHRDVFRTQLRALLRASRHGTLRILFPFLSGVEEFCEARDVLEEAAAELSARGEPLEGLPPVGAMLEIPSAAATADLLAREVDFFSIGTNDLIQYTLAVDRSDERTSHLYQPLHPAVLRTIRTAVRAAARLQRPIALCGEVASEPAILPLLVGLGLRNFSMNPAALPVARDTIERLRVDEARRLAQRVMRQPTVADIERVLAGTGAEPLSRAPAAAPSANMGDERGHA